MIEADGLTGLNGVRHGFFTRAGGVSTGDYASLNCGYGSKDARDAVDENRRRVATALGAAPERLITAYQTHSAEAIAATHPWTREQAPKVDAVVTTVPGLALGVLTADCAPVLFCDPEGGVVGAAHAGWRGALTGILEATIAEMERHGASRGRIAAAVGPAISQDCYEVGEEFEDRFLAEHADNRRYFRRPQPDARPHFDLTAYVADRLRAAGLGKVEDVGLCTYAADSRFFSYRRCVHRGEDDYGRQISAIVLP